MIGVFKRAARRQRFASVFYSAWERMVDRLEPPWGDRLRAAFRADSHDSFEEFVRHVDDARLATRFFLAAHTLRLAQFGVLIIPAPPKLDETKYRDGELVTGALKDQLDRVFESKRALKILDVSQPDRISNKYDFCLVEYQRAYAVSQSFNALRVQIEHPSHPDWYGPSVKILYAYCEHEMRRAISMPSALDDDFIQPLKYSAIVDIIKNGWADPYSEWKKLDAT